MVINGEGTRVAGYYTFFLNGEQVFEAPSKNLITDYGWTRICALGVVSTSSSSLAVGTSNVPPTLADTDMGATLATKVGSTSGATGTGSDANGNFTYSRYAFQFAQGAVVGNVAEVGFKVNSGDSSLTSRSLVKDGSGNPAVIVVTAIDQLTVQYELRYYRASIDVTGTVMVAGVSTTYVLRTATPTAGTASSNVTNIGGLTPSFIDSIVVHGPAVTFGAPNTDPVGGGTATQGVAALVGTTVTVGTTSTTVTFTTPTMGTGTGNVGGCGAIKMALQTAVTGILGAYGNIKVSFSPAIPKDGTKTLSFSFSFTFTRL